MEAGLEFQAGRTWEEEIYWTHFNTINFCLRLPIDFHDHLILPLKFSENLMTELPNKVPLTGPGGAVWEVTLMKTNNVAFIGDGWKDFVKAYGLEVNWILVFKYKRSVGFQVLIFDSMTSCEKESAYFVKKHVHTMPKHHDDEKTKVYSEAHSTEVLEEEEEDEDHDSECMTSKKSKNVEDLVCMEETNHLETQINCSPIGLTEGKQSRGRSRPRKVSKPRKVSALRYASNSKAKCGGENVKGNETAEKEPVPGNSGGTEISNDHKSNETTGENSKGNETAEKEPVLGNRGGIENEISNYHKSNEATGDGSNGNEAAKEQNSVEIIRSNPVRVFSQRNRKSESRSNKKFASVSSGKRVSDDGNQPNGVECANEQNSDENGASTPEVLLSLRPTKRRLAYKASENLSFKSDRTQRLSNNYGFKGRPTKGGKENALQSAQKKQTKKSFISVMRRSSIGNCFFVNIPAEWVRKFTRYLPLRTREVVLHVGEKTYIANFCCRANRTGAGLTGPGWRTCAVENVLKEFDVCLFTLVSERGDPAMVFEVDIFRVPHRLQI